MCVLLGGELGAVTAGFANLGTRAAVGLIVAGLVLAPWTGLAGFTVLHRVLRRRRGLHGPPVMETAAAKIEAVREIREGEEVLLQLDLTVAPATRPAYRANAGVDVHLPEVNDYRVGHVVVIDYDTARPWRIVVRKQPGAAWAARLAAIRIDTAPPTTRRTAPHREHLGTAPLYLTATTAGLLGSLWPLWALCS
ncbi:hypothetical protein [Kitasatospora sp. NPDC058190]|uniref:hypothetical protein n=1 Tax=Kitasatospora sp. NPDC058190 TaxID=3346371 RepID=UPI0036D82EAA